MANLPKGFWGEAAKSEATVPRVRLKDGEYIFLHRQLIQKHTTKGDAIIIEHRIVDAKPIVAGVEPTPIGTNYGHFLPQYGNAAVMCQPNLVAYTVGLLGIDQKSLSVEQLGARMEELFDEKRLARGMLIRGVTFHTEKKSDGEDFQGVNWFPMVGENIATAPSVIQRRRELEAEVGGIEVVTPPSPPVGAIPPPPPGDPLQAALVAGWVKHPTAPGWFWNPRLPDGQNMRSEADLRSGRM